MFLTNCKTFIRSTDLVLRVPRFPWQVSELELNCRDLRGAAIRSPAWRTCRMVTQVDVGKWNRWTGAKGRHEPIAQLLLKKQKQTQTYPTSLSMPPLHQECLHYIHPSMGSAPLGVQCPLTRCVSRLMGLALVSWAFARIGVHRLFPSPSIYRGFPFTLLHLPLNFIRVTSLRLMYLHPLVNPSLTHFLGDFRGLGLALVHDVVVPQCIIYLIIIIT